MRSFWFESAFTKHLAARCVRRLYCLTAGMTTSLRRPITSHPVRSDFDVAIRHWRQAGLNVASTIRIDKLSVLAKDEVVRRIGNLTSADRSSVGETLRRAISWAD